MLAPNIQKQNRKLTYKRHHNYRNVSQILAHLPPSPRADSNVEQKKPPFHTITFALNNSYQAGSKQHSYYARSLTPSSCKRTSPPKKINPYTNAQYLYFQQKRNQRKEQELIRKCEKIDKMLKPVHISKIQIPSNLWRNVEGTSNHRPKSQRERTMNRSKSMSRPCTNKESKNNIFQKVSLEADILPWGEEINIIQHF